MDGQYTIYQKISSARKEHKMISKGPITTQDIVNKIIYIKEKLRETRTKQNIIIALLVLNIITTMGVIIYLHGIEKAECKVYNFPPVEVLEVDR